MKLNDKKTDVTSAVTREDFYGTWIDTHGFTHTISADTYELSKKSKPMYKFSGLKWTALEDEKGRYPFGFSTIGKAESKGFASFQVGDEVQHRFYFDKNKGAMKIVSGYFIDMIAKRSAVVQKAKEEKQAIKQTERQAKKAKKEELGISFKYVDCSTNTLEIKDLQRMIWHKGYLIILQELFLSVWDTADPENLQKVAEFRFPQRRFDMRLFGDELYVWGKWIWEDKSHIHILNISDPLHIIQKQDIALQDDTIEINGLYVSNGRIFTTGHGIMEILCNGTANILFAGGAGDIVVHQSLLITKGSKGFDGICLFDVGEKLTEIKDIPAQFVIPSNISWWEEGKSILILGNDENVLKMDISNPTKTKRTKQANTEIGLGRQFAKDGDTIFVLGTSIKSRNHAPAVCAIDVSGESPELVYKQIIKEYKTKTVGSDSAKGIVKIGDYLILATYHCQLGVVKIIK